jgi:LmbE family N-acetylglucosaminyl deacetylase
MSPVYLSPHLDDAVLSCGGAIRRQAARGEPVVVITLITEDVAPGTALSPFAQRFHDQCGGPPRLFSLRRAEDLAALTLLGARAMHLDCLDAIYRRGTDGAWLYADGSRLFGQVHPDDPLAQDGGRPLAGRLVELLASAVLEEPSPRIYAPLAVGQHVDHQITHAAARILLEWGYGVVFYEDLPYAERAGATEAALAAAGADGWWMEAQALEAGDVAAKATALGYYRSQLPMLFDGGEAMISRVWGFAATCAPEVGLAERLWWPPGGPRPGEE